ncbi:hypothetical protein NUSPORA_00897 [Nucleospora cyclopteri]
MYVKKLKQYNLLASELSLIYKCNVEIIPFVLTWDGVITKYRDSTLKIEKVLFLINELSLIYKCKVEIIPFVLTWDGVITKCYSMYVKKLKQYNLLASD